MIPLAGQPLPLEAPQPPVNPAANRFKLIHLLEIDTATPDGLARSLPFTPYDTTAGAENEYQTAVLGDREQVDLACEIEASGFFRNLKKRARRGDTPQFRITALERFLESNHDRVWENSWVRLPVDALTPYARQVFAEDLQADKRRKDSPQRSDACQFSITMAGCEYLRIPISYLLKLALADAVGHPSVHATIRDAGQAAMNHFLSDNTSPETFSFHPVCADGQAGPGDALARETSLRFLFSQLLIQYANRQFGLIDSGQRATLYFAPHPPLRQKRLNALISDSFYRSLFMSPCLSGWNDGEAKHRYMHLCHTVLSRSQLNAVIKLREAGIVANNLVVLPSTSNISLANNGTHISLGSRRLTGCMQDPGSGFGPAEEKHYGDLAIKIIEHFLPLFVGTFSAAPYRIDFMDFHPERVLGFLPHELDFTHLRMLWRRWKKKAHMKILGRCITPFGPEWLDRTLARGFGLKGDFVPDFRLIDYLVALMATDESPALDGCLGNETRLKQDLGDMGVFDPCMPLYMLYRARCFQTMGFSGFEGRHYSLFENLQRDMAPAANLQMLVTSLAYKYIFTGAVTHADIPDHPFIESERRQIFFGTAAGIPTFYVRTDTPNHLLARMVRKTANIRNSRRYAGYTRVRMVDFRQMLVKLLHQDAPELIEAGGLGPTLADLARRTAGKGCHTAAGRLTRRICDNAGAAAPMALSSDEFNSAAEKFYREDLKKEQIEQALDVWTEQVRHLDGMSTWRRGIYNQALFSVLGGKDAATEIRNRRSAVVNEALTTPALARLIHLMLLTLTHMKRNPRSGSPNDGVLPDHATDTPPVH
ncbi:hypothetical protein [Desulfosarcina ovata]|uniref:Uncharacterized protein n=1 Tax=Desulfosarcina ovata subsp. ovata TaxID=2752305 RepID=A0A5K8AKT9_9BACT|nr:hypothetical protein [Desulfosarcina ovata]BBO93116.1 hypothetical protein DSCOOX_62960 [Desulfosarcina ovata subsp. ovata]